MNKIMNWVIAATLICGPAVFTSCTSDSEDNPEKEQAKRNRQEFVQHTRSTLKTLAENMNFTSWETANSFNQRFNQHVLNNEEFENSLWWTIMHLAASHAEDIEEGSELAEMGYKRSITIDLSDFKYRFTMRPDKTDFNWEKADEFELIFNGWNPMTQQVENGLYKVNLKSSGTSSKRIIPINNTDGGVVLFILPSEIQFTMSSKLTGTWNDDFSGILHYLLPEGAVDTSQGFTADATINSNILSGTVGNKSDKTQLTVSITSDRVHKQGTGHVSYIQNDKKLLELSVKESGDDMDGAPKFDLSQFPTTASVFDVLAAILTNRRLDEAKLTLLDDLTTTISISDMSKAMQLARENAAARRNYADRQTIDQYTQQMNELITCSMTCKGVNQTIPMRMVTTKFGVDWWSMPAFNFSDETGYVSFVDLLDPESVQYGINIIDHAAEPMQQSVIVVRQLIEFMTLISKKFQMIEIALDK